MQEAEKTIKKQDAQDEKKRKGEQPEVEKPKRRRGKQHVDVAAGGSSEPANPSQPSNPQKTAEITAEIPDPAAAAASAAAKKEAAGLLRRKNAKVGLEALAKAQIEDLKLPDIATFEKLSFTCPAPSWVHGSRSIGVVLQSQSFYVGKCVYGSGDLGMPSGCEHLKASPFVLLHMYFVLLRMYKTNKLLDVICESSINSKSICSPRQVDKKQGCTIPWWNTEIKKAWDQAKRMAGWPQTVEAPEAQVATPERTLHAEDFYLLVVCNFFTCTCYCSMPSL